MHINNIKELTQNQTKMEVCGTKRCIERKLALRETPTKFHANNLVLKIFSHTDKRKYTHTQSILTHKVYSHTDKRKCVFASRRICSCVNVLRGNRALTFLRVYHLPRVTGCAYFLDCNDSSKFVDFLIGRYEVIYVSIFSF